MKAVKLLPLVYIVGIDGFNLFMPYMLLVGLLVLACRRIRLVS